MESKVWKSVNFVPSMRSLQRPRRPRAQTVTLAARQVVLRDLLGVQFVVLENMEKAAPNVISDSIERGVTTERRMRPSVVSLLDFFFNSFPRLSFFLLV
jgi:hypothetical protein